MSRRRRFVLLSAVLVTVVIVSKRFSGSESSDWPHFDGFDNETGAGSAIVPNVVHLVRFGAEWNFVDAVCLLSAWKHHRPDRIVIHVDPQSVHFMSGPYWQRIRREIDGDALQIRRRPVPTHVFGVRLSSIYHAADVARLQILMEEGGIFLDNDVYVVRSLEPFRHFEMALGWPPGDYIGTQVLVAHRNARFLRMWLNGYRHYQPTNWYYNAGHLPTRFLEKNPHLVHRVPHSFGVHVDVASWLYVPTDDATYQRLDQFHAIHLLIRHRSKLVPDDIRRSNGTRFDPSNIQGYAGHFGRLARLVWNPADASAPVDATSKT